MSRKRLFVATEELEVDKLHREHVEAEKKGEFDVLYQGVKEDIEAKEATQTSEEETDTPLEGEEDTSTESPEANETEDVDTGDAAIAAESFLRHHLNPDTFTIAIEHGYSDNTSTIASYVGDKALSGLTYLKNIGFEYGPVLLKHVYKGVLYAMNKTVRAVIQGGLSTAKYIDKKVHSYNNLKSDLLKVKETLDLLEDKKIDTEFTKDVVINQLKIGNNLDFKASAKVAQRFFEDFFDGFEKNVRSNIAVTRNIVNSVSHEQTVQPQLLTYERFNFSNFVRKNVDGYVSSSQCVDSYAYQFILPGDLIFVGWLPKHNLTDHDQIIEALNNSKMVLGVNTHGSIVKDSVAYHSLTDLKAMIDILITVCDYGIELEKTYDTVIKNRNALRGVLNVYMRFLLSAKHKVSLRDSLADFISLKVASIDRTHIAGSMYVNDYMVRVVTASLSYLRDAVKVYS